MKIEKKKLRSVRTWPLLALIRGAKTLILKTISHYRLKKLAAPLLHVFALRKFPKMKRQLRY
jgi:hypothetical protein